MTLENFYRNKKIFITGHTGFKGTWLSLWLKTLGANITGYALPPEDLRGNLFKITGLKDEIYSVEGDIRDRKQLTQILKQCDPEIIFHLAAQPLVIDSYENPIFTYESNVTGTINLLNIARDLPRLKSILVITTDKCYDNNEWLWGYRETDRLGGADPYSCSKAMAEMAVNSYYKSYFKDLNIGLATARAGNVLGGGDFAKYRIVPNIVESIQKDFPALLRYPHAVRPWQHVLDVLHGYLLLVQSSYNDPKKFSTSFNFSSDDCSNKYTVEYITKKFIDIIGAGRYKIEHEKQNRYHESTYLRLDSSKAKNMLNWVPKFTTEQTITMTVQWYQALLKQNNDSHLKQIVRDQINNYMPHVNGASL